MNKQIRVISYGGGVQSTALIVLAAQGRIDFHLAAFANVGDDSEHPATLEYVQNVAIPWATDHGIQIAQLRRIMRTGEERTLWQHLMQPGSRSVPIPVRMNGNGAPGRRSCTADYKIKVIARHLRALGATKTNPAVVAVGISTDEFHRASNRRAHDFEIPEYPLLDLGISRNECERIIRDAGLPVPPKSACFFCPFQRKASWQQMRKNEPDLFLASQLLEDTLNERRQRLGKDPVWLTGYGRRLSEAVQMPDPTLFDEGPDECDSGYCWT